MCQYSEKWEKYVVISLIAFKLGKSCTETLVSTKILYVLVM